MTYDEFLGRLDGVQRTGPTSATALCPAHHDLNPSLSVTSKDDGRNFLAHCHAGCTFERITTMAKIRGITRLPGVVARTTIRREVAVYDYANEHGDLLYQVVRYEPKGFRQRRPNSDGGWIYNLTGVRRVLYHLPQLQGQTKVFVCEGEKDADNLRALGLAATTSAQGAGKWADEYSVQLRAAGVEQVVILPDNDTAGEKHAEDVARFCLKARLQVKIVHLPNLPEKGDVSDWLEAGHDEVALFKVEGQVQFVTPDDLPARGSRPETIRLGGVEAEPVEWLWPGRVPRGNVCLIVGDPGLGKSKVTLDIASRHSRGRPWPDGAPGTPGVTILLTAEDNLASTVRPRVDALRGDATRITVVRAVRDENDVEHPFKLESDLPALEQAIDESGADLVIIDPLSAYLGKTDSHNDSALRGVLGPLSALAERRRVAIVAIMHLTKDQQRKALYRAQGSIAFVAFARMVLGVVEDKTIDTRRLLVPIKSNLAEKPPALAFSHAGQGLAWEPTPVADADVEALFQSAKPEEAPQRRSAEGFLREALRDGAQRAETVKAWARENGIAPRTLDRAKATLRVQVEKQGFEESFWTWRLPETPLGIFSGVLRSSWRPSCDATSGGSSKNATPPEERHVSVEGVGVLRGGVLRSEPPALVKRPVLIEVERIVKRPLTGDAA